MEGLNLNLPNLPLETLRKVQEIIAGAGFTDFMTGQPVLRKDITTATGLVAVNLEPLARLLQPINTPLRNRLPRIRNTKGGTSVAWKAIASLDLTAAEAFEAEGSKAPTITYTVADKSANFATIAKGDNVSFEAQAAGLTFEDVKSRAVIRLLKNVMIKEHQFLWGGRKTILGTVTAPTATVVDGGGTIPDAANYYLIARAVTNLGRGKKSSSTNITGAAANGNDSAITAHTPWVEGASAYDWYLSTDNATFHFQQRTQLNSVSMTAYDSAGAALPADNSVDANGFDAMIAQLTAANGALITTLATGTDGVGTDFTLTDVNDLLQRMWDNGQASPTRCYIPSQQHRRFQALWLASNGGPTQFVATPGGQGDLTGGYFMRSYLNPVTGQPIQFEIDPWLLAGQMVFASEEMPIPASDIDVPAQVETQADYQQIDYALAARKFEFEVYIREALKIYFAQGFGVLRNCSTKTSA